MITIAIVIAALTAALAAAVIVMLQAGIAREESDRTLLADPTTRAAKATRCLVGLYVRTPDHRSEAARHPDSDAPGSDRNPPARPGR
jgi:hypothetical protein